MSTTYGPGRFESIVDRSITEIKSNVKTIGAYAFSGCTALTTAEFPNATSIGDYAFSGCTNLKNLQVANFSMINGVMTGSGSFTYGYLFQNCTSINSVHLEISSSVSSNYFLGCTGLQTAVYIHNISADGGTAVFNGCKNLKTADLTVRKLRNNYFYNNDNLDTIILRYISISVLEDTKVFSTAAHFKSGGTGGTIYIPKALYDHLGDGTSSDYKAAENWSTVDGYGTITWAQIEGSQYENYYADGTPIT